MMSEISGYFPTFEQSLPQYETDGLRWVTVFSPALGHRVDLTIAAPYYCENYTNLPLVILLHGVYGSHWCWAMKGGAHRTLHRLIEQGTIRPMVLAMPSDGLLGSGSGYVCQNGVDYESWIAREVRMATHIAVPGVTDNSSCFIGGLSMGGYGAMRIGARFPDRFRAISGHSSITSFDQISQFIPDMPDPDQWAGREDRDVAHVMLGNREQLPALRFDCGRDDPLIEANRALHRKLQSAGINHWYEECEGGHTWDYWSRHLEDTLIFFSRFV
jgi:putative tributyrin esterase